MSKRDYLKLKKPTSLSAKDIKSDYGHTEYEKELSIEFLRELYNAGGGFEYTDEQLVLIRSFLLTMTEIAVECYKRQKINNSNLHHDENINNKTESNTVRESEYRRTG